jgi:hypothetical protein
MMMFFWDLASTDESARRKSHKNNIIIITAVKISNLTGESL